MKEVKDWSFVGVWNASLLNAETRTVVPRDYLWASELGKAPIDIYLRMSGVEATNPPNPRSLRKFEAGNVFEWIVSLILKRAGILDDAQTYCVFQYPGMLKVTGKADFIAGGTPDFKKAVEEMEQLDLPEVFVRAAKAIQEYFDREYPEGLVKKPIEIKSVSSFMFEAIERAKKPQKIHRLQLFHYLKAEDYERGSIIYICRDDLRMMEFPVFNHGPETEIEKEYFAFIKTMTDFYNSGKQPPLENPIIFDEDSGRFSANFNVAYSGYLTMLYGLKDQKEFDDMYRKDVGKWNRVMNRVKNGDKMTKKNIEILAEIAEAGFDPAILSAKFIGSAEEEELETVAE